MTDHLAGGTEHEHAEQEGAAVDALRELVNAHDNLTDTKEKTGCAFAQGVAYRRIHDAIQAARKVLAAAPDSRAPLPITSGSNEQSPVRDEEREAALEEAAKVCDGLASEWLAASRDAENAQTGISRRVRGSACEECATAIRDLKSAIAEQDGRKG